MQQHHVSLEVLSAAAASGHAREALAQPVLLDAALLGHIVGGGPNGGRATQGPNGGWTTATISPKGPNGGWA